MLTFSHQKFCWVDIIYAKKYVFCSGYGGWNGTEYPGEVQLPDGVCGYPIIANPSSRYVGVVGMNGTKEMHTLQQHSVFEKNANLHQVLNAPLQMVAGGHVVPPSNRVQYQGGAQMLRAPTSDGTNIRLPPAYNQYRFRNYGNCVPAATHVLYPSEIQQGVMRPNMPPTSNVGRFMNQSVPGCRTNLVNGYTDNYMPQRNGYCSNPSVVGHGSVAGFMQQQQHSHNDWNTGHGPVDIPVQHTVATCAGFMSNANSVVQGRSLMSPSEAVLPNIPFTVCNLQLFHFCVLLIFCATVYLLYFIVD